MGEISDEEISDEEISDEVRNFLDYVAGRGIKGDFIKELDEAVQKVKESKEWRLSYMTYELALMEREERGREEERFELIKNLLTADTPLKYIIKATGWSEEKLLEFKKSQIDSQSS